MKTTTETNHAEQNAEAWLGAILDYSHKLSALEGEERDELIEQISNEPLSVEARSDWHPIGQSPKEDAEYCILLSTGGPALRLIGHLQDGEPSSARLEWQDWGTPWTEYHRANEYQDSLMAYARCFYFVHYC